ncbi:MAG: DUF1801 domain-containing protein [Phycisphaerales bacterium]|nr:DUF1801 domain-containing protein [Phycisphaerales bacterium]
MTSATPPTRVSKQQRTQHLIDQPPVTRKIVETLRATILATAPHASEAFKFRVLCYFHADASFGALGGNICMIEVKRGEVFLSFIHGALLPDPRGLLAGKGKFKRFARIADAQHAAGTPIKDLVRAAATLRPWD